MRVLPNRLRIPLAMVPAVAWLLVLPLLSPARAADDGAPWSGDGAGDLPAETFEASFGSAPDAPGGMIGGSGMGYRSRLTLAPRYERLKGHAYLWLGSGKEVTGVDLYRHDPGASLAQLDWQATVPAVDTPPGGVDAVRFVYDTGTAKASSGSGPYPAPWPAEGGPGWEAPVPGGAAQLLHVEVDWSWADGWTSAPIASRTLVFPAADHSSSADDAGSTGMAGLITGAIIVTLGAVSIVGAGHWLPAARTWVGIRLVDDRGDPVPGQPYRLVDVDGQVFTGSVDESGGARVESVAAGPVSVSFPEIDASEWGQA